ncbi:MAG: MotA/TolQ/ExbB proton channel family protein [Rectinemataceae bacterium]|nr:MotA/TolQ/ExbB proton channel family protein [Rectinemataceae bacterium]
MTPDALIKSFIYLVSSSLLYPTLILLVFLTVAMISYAGAFLSEWIERARLKKAALSEIRTQALNNDIGSIMPHKVVEYVDDLKNMTGRHEWKDSDVEYLLQSKCALLAHSLDRLKQIIRLGPALGLMGTLIPMGTALAGLGQGDMTKLSGDLVIAFTTTVVGLAQGMAAYSIYAARRRWIEEDIRNMEYITELLQNEIHAKEKISSG